MPVTAEELANRPMKVTAEEMEAAQLPLEWRDHCAHILIPLNKCRRKTAWMPWECTDLRHAYEKCQYEEYKLRCEAGGVSSAH